MDSMTERNFDRSERLDDASKPTDREGEARKALIAGLIGAAIGTAGYLIYSRLEEEQKDALRRTVAKFVEDKISDVRSQLKL